MKELELTLVIRNNRLKERRIALGLTQAALARLMGMTQTQYGPFECLRANPRKRNGEWSKLATRIAEFYEVSCEELFPPGTAEVKNTKAAIRVDVAECLSLMDPSLLALPAPADVLPVDPEKLAECMAGLTNREQRILRLRYGLEDGESWGRDRIGEDIGVSRERVRQIEVQAIQKLRKVVGR